MIFTDAKFNYSGIPAALRALPNWVCWRIEKAADGRKTKRPYNVASGKWARTDDPATWTSFDKAADAYQRGGYDGIGLVFSADCGFWFIDLDTVRDAETGAVAQDAQELLYHFNSACYIEISVSGFGYHIIGRGSPNLTGGNRFPLEPNGIARLDEAGKHKAPEVEFYTAGRFCALTGTPDILWGSSSPTWADSSADVEAFHRRFVERKNAVPERSTGEQRPLLSDDELIDRARKYEKFDRLWRGDFQGYPSQSEADLALCNMLAYWTGRDAEQMDRIFRQSGLMRGKWDRKQSGSTYGKLTIKKAVDECPRVYSGRATAKEDFYAVKIGPAKKKDDVFGRSNAKPEKLPTFSAAELQDKKLPPLKFIVNNVLPQGLALLASPPKYGKSWLVLDLCLSVAAGKPFLGRGTQKTGCLYLALEDSARRLQDRMNKILVGEKAPDNCNFLLTAPDLGSGLIESLDGYVSEKPETGLIVVDTLQKVRAPANGKESAYGADYREVGALKKFADKRGICVLLVHHLRKMVDDLDPFNMISGTNGIMGAADTSFVLTRKARADKETKLSYTGRDIDQGEVVMSFNKSDYKWHILGNAEEIEEKHAEEEYEQDPIVLTIKKLLKQSPAGWSGTMNDLLEAGKHFAGTYLAATARDLANKVKALTPSLWNYDKIVHERAKNGGGGGRHHFYTATVTFKHPPLVTVDGKSTGEEHEKPRIIPFS